MKLNQSMTTSLILNAAFLCSGSAHAATILVGTPDFTLSSSSSAGTTHDNLPVAFLAQVTSGAITPSTSMGVVSSFTLDKAADGSRVHNSGAWASASSPGGGTLSLSFPSADVAGMAFNWAWGDRTPGDYEIVINGATSLGTFNVDGGGGTGAVQSTEPNTYVIFDTVQTGVTSIDINMSFAGAGNTNNWGFDEVEVYTGAAPAAVPEPSTTALLGLGGLALVLRRRRK